MADIKKGVAGIPKPTPVEDIASVLAKYDQQRATEGKKPNPDDRRYIGHVLRNGNEEEQKVALTWTPEGKRKRGRPRETCRKTAKRERERNEMGWPASWSAAENVASDKAKWRDVYITLCQLFEERREMMKHRCC